MRLQNYLTEKYLKGFNFRHAMTGEMYIEIFENPSKKELRELTHQYGVRFFADKRIKKVYAWDPRLIHTQALRYLKHKIKPFKTPAEGDNLIAGIAEERGGEYHMTQGADVLGLVNSNNLFGNILIDIDSWSWVDKYIKITPFLKRISK